jgi:hypothetical protein
VSQGERIEFRPFNTPKVGSFCYLSSLIEYRCLGYLYCTRCCSYVQFPDMTERQCEDDPTNNLGRDESCKQYDADLLKPK